MTLLPPWDFGPTFFLPQHVHYTIQLFIFWAFIWWPPVCFSVVHIHATYPSTPLPAVTHMHLPIPAFLPVPACLHLLYAPKHLSTHTSPCLCTSASTLSALPPTSHPVLPLPSGLKSVHPTDPRMNLAAGIYFGVWVQPLFFFVLMLISLFFRFTPLAHLHLCQLSPACTCLPLLSCLFLLTSTCCMHPTTCLHPPLPAHAHPPPPHLPYLWPLSQCFPCLQDWKECIQTTQEWTRWQEYSLMYEFNLFFSLCSCLFLCCLDSYHLPTYTSACCHLHALVYLYFPTLPACHVHLPPSALALPAHAHVPSPAHVHPYTPTTMHCYACPCLPAYAWVSSLYFFFLYACAPSKSSLPLSPSGSCCPKTTMGNVPVCNGHKMLTFPPLAIPTCHTCNMAHSPTLGHTCYICAMVHLPALSPHLLHLPHFPTCGCTCLCLPHFSACAHLPSCTCLTLLLISVQLPVAVHLTSSCTQRSPQLWAFSDIGAVNSIKGYSEDSRSTPTCLNCGLWPTGCRYRCM